MEKFQITAKEQKMILARRVLSGEVPFEAMISEAAKWQGAALKVDKLLSGNKERLKHSKMTTKGDLDAYLMRKFGVDATTARDVSNSLTRNNIKPDKTAKISDFKSEPWAIS